MTTDTEKTDETQGKSAVDDATIAELAAGTDVGDDELEAMGVLDRVKAIRETAEKTEGEGEDEGEEPEAEPETEADPPKEPGHSSGGGPMIPKARFDDALAKERRKFEEAQAEFERRLAEAREQMQSSGGGQETASAAASPPKTVFQEIEEKRIALAERLDDGDIGYVEAERERIALENLERDARKEEAGTEKLVEANPWFDVLDEPSRISLYNEGLRRMGNSGVQVGTPLGRLALRRAVVEAGKEWGWDRPEESTKKPEGKIASERMAGQAKAGSDKLALAERAPPNLSRTKSDSATVPGSLTDEDLAKMSPKEILALPSETRNRIYAESEAV